MRVGHNWLSSLEEWLEATPQVASGLDLMEERQLVDQHRSQHVAPGGAQAFGRHWPCAIEDALELAVEVLDGPRAQFVEDAPDRRAGVGVRIGAALGGDQRALLSGALPLDGGVVVSRVAQHKEVLQRQRIEQG